MYKALYIPDTVLAATLEYGSALLRVPVAVYTAAVAKLAPGDWTYLRVSYKSTTEIVKVIGRIAPDTLIVTRHVDGTDESYFPIGAVLGYAPTVAGAVDAYVVPVPTLVAGGAISVVAETIEYPNLNLDVSLGLQPVGSGASLIIGRNEQAYGCCHDNNTPYPIDTGGGTPPDPPPPYAPLSGAYFIGGIRRIVGGYTGPLFRAKNLTTLVEQDIYADPVSRELNLGVLLDLAGSDDVGVLKIYKQLGISSNIDELHYITPAPIVVGGVYLGYMRSVDNRLLLASEGQFAAGVSPNDTTLPALIVHMKVGVPAAATHRYMMNCSGFSWPYTLINTTSFGWMTPDYGNISVTQTDFSTSDHNKYAFDHFADGSRIAAEWAPNAALGYHVNFYVDGELEPKTTVLSSAALPNTVSTGASFQFGGLGGSSICEQHLECIAMYYKIQSEAERKQAAAAL